MAWKTIGIEVPADAGDYVVNVDSDGNATYKEFTVSLDDIRDWVYGEQVVIDDYVQHDGVIYKAIGSGGNYTGTVPGTGINWKDRWVPVLGKPGEEVYTRYSEEQMNRYNTYYYGDIVKNGTTLWVCKVYKVRPIDAFEEGKQYPVTTDSETTAINGTTVWEVVPTL